MLEHCDYSTVKPSRPLTTADPDEPKPLDMPLDSKDSAKPRNGNTEPVSPPQSQLSDPVIETGEIKITESFDAGHFSRDYAEGDLFRQSGVMPNGPSSSPSSSMCSSPSTFKVETTQDLAMLEYGGDNEALLATEDSIDIEPAADSGAVDHVAGPKHIPGSTLVVTTADTRDFRSANNGVIKNHGEATIELEQDGGPTMSSTV